MKTNEVGTEVLLVIEEEPTRDLLARIIQAEGLEVYPCASKNSVLERFRTRQPLMAIMASDLEGGAWIQLAGEMLEYDPAFPVILIAKMKDPDMLIKAIRAGIRDVLYLPLKVDEITRSIRQTLSRDSVVRDRMRRSGSDGSDRNADQSLVLDTIVRLGRIITSSQDLDKVLGGIVSAAVDLTGAEEGSLLLLDEETGTLTMRASKNFQEAFAQTFRLPVADPLISQVLKTGKPFILDERTPVRIKTAYLVYSLVYVPLKKKDKIIGVLGIDNRIRRQVFSKHDIMLLSTLAEYAVIAIDNTRLFNEAEISRGRLQTIVDGIREGVIVVDEENRLVLVNTMARYFFNLGGEDLQGRPFLDVFHQPELVNLLAETQSGSSSQFEMTLQDGTVVNTHLVVNAGIGSIIELHDISTPKRLEQIKTDFINTVSHDLRSPLTAIMGYVELIERVGQVNDKQKEFVQNVVAGVQNITTLLDDLLNMGRIETGFAAHRESIKLDRLVQLTIDGKRDLLEGKKLKMIFSVSPGLPNILANPIQVQQMLNNLIENAIRGTHEGGNIFISLNNQGDQALLVIKDTGAGIAPMDLPYVFDRFYRSGNVQPGTMGSGLGLSIVKSIVESHNGRIWADSVLGEGTTFTIVLPASGN